MDGLVFDVLVAETGVLGEIGADGGDDLFVGLVHGGDEVVVGKDVVLEGGDVGGAGLPGEKVFFAGA